MWHVHFNNSELLTMMKNNKESKINVSLRSKIEVMACVRKRERNDRKTIFDTKLMHNAKEEKEREEELNGHSPNTRTQP